MHPHPTPCPRHTMRMKSGRCRSGTCLLCMACSACCWCRRRRGLRVCLRGTRCTGSLSWRPGPSCICPCHKACRRLSLQLQPLSASPDRRTYQPRTRCTMPGPCQSLCQMSLQSVPSHSLCRPWLPVGRRTCQLHMVHKYFVWSSFGTGHKGSECMMPRPGRWCIAQRCNRCTWFARWRPRTCPRRTSSKGCGSFHL
jgi:hypothetical protein